MRTRRTAVIVFLGVFLLGAAAGLAADRIVIGASPSHWLADEYRMSIGVTAAGNPDRARKIRLDREVINVPDYYGTVVSVTTVADRTVIWYASERMLRNVILDGTDDSLFALQSVPVKELRMDARR